MTAFSTVENAVDAMRHGAYDYLNKPFDLDEVALCVEKALETSRLRSEVRALRSTQAAGLQLRRDHRRSRRRCGGQDAARPHRRQPGVHGAAHRRDGHRQGPGRQGDPLQQRSRGEAVREHHVLGAAGAAARKRALRTRARRVHRRASAEARPVRDRRRRHGVPRRDRRDDAGAAVQAAALPRREDVQARWRPHRHPRGRARDCRHQPRSRRGSARGEVPRRPVLPPAGDADRAAVAARAARRRAAARASGTSNGTTRSSASASAG